MEKFKQTWQYILQDEQERKDRPLPGEDEIMHVYDELPPESSASNPK